MFETGCGIEVNERPVSENALAAPNGELWVASAARR
jgi:hypothetical protein